MADRIPLGKGVEVGREILQRDPVVLGKPVGRMLGLLGSEIELGPVTCGEDCGLPHRFDPDKISQSLVQQLGTKRHLLANRERRSVMVQSESKQLHAWRAGMRNCQGAIISPGLLTAAAGIVTPTSRSSHSRNACTAGRSEIASGIAR